MLRDSTPAEIMRESRQQSPVIIIQMAIRSWTEALKQVAFNREVVDGSAGLLEFVVGESTDG